jgi:hypothetical protein
VALPGPLGDGPADLVVLTADVPADATYRTHQVIEITGVLVNEGALAAVGDHAVHVAAFLGDATGNEAYSALDGQRVLRLAALLDTGFAPYPLVDPVVIADVTGNGAISSLDATRVLQEVVGLDRVEIPPLPGEAAPLTLSVVGLASTPGPSGDASGELEPAIADSRSAPDDHAEVAGDATLVVAADVVSMDDDDVLAFGGRSFDRLSGDAGRDALDGGPDDDILTHESPELTRGGRDDMLVTDPFDPAMAPLGASSFLRASGATTVSTALPSLIDWSGQYARRHGVRAAVPVGSWLRQEPGDVLDAALDVNRDLRIELPVALETERGSRADF